jgi:hypothetical protein
MEGTAGPQFSGPALTIEGGDVAQLGEHLVRNEGVVGSNPIISTSFNGNPDGLFSTSAAGSVVGSSGEEIPCDRDLAGSC